MFTTISQWSYQLMAPIMGYVFPSFFAIGTALPVIILTLILSYLGLSGALLKKSRKIGRNVQITAGLFMILIGIYDSFLYWM